jgi:hypothetical protein
MDCGRLHQLAALIPDANCPPGLCPVCAGPNSGMAMLCAADGPQVTALAAGDWHSDAAFLQPHAAARAISWTPDGGLVMRADAVNANDRE